MAISTWPSSFSPSKAMTCLWSDVLARVDVRDEVADAALVVELLGLAAGTLVDEPDAQTARQERRLAEALGEGRGRELRLVEDLRVRQERHGRPGLLRLADDLHVTLRHAPREGLAMDLAVAADLDDEPLRERVHDGEADSMQASRHLVPVSAELAASVQLRQDDRQRRDALVLHHVDRDAATAGRAP